MKPVHIRIWYAKEVIVKIWTLDIKFIKELKGECKKKIRTVFDRKVIFTAKQNQILYKNIGSLVQCSNDSMWK